MHVETQNRWRQHQRQRHHRFHQEFPPPPRKRDPIRQRHPDEQKDRGGGSREPHAEPDGLIVHINRRATKSRIEVEASAPPAPSASLETGGPRWNLSESRHTVPSSDRSPRAPPSIAPGRGPLEPRPARTPRNPH